MYRITPTERHLHHHRRPYEIKEWGRLCFRMIIWYDINIYELYIDIYSFIWSLNVFTVVWVCKSIIVCFNASLILLPCLFLTFLQLINIIYVCINVSPYDSLFLIFRFIQFAFFWSAVYNLPVFALNMASILHRYVLCATNVVMYLGHMTYLDGVTSHDFIFLC